MSNKFPDKSCWTNSRFDFLVAFNNPKLNLHGKLNIIEKARSAELETCGTDLSESQDKSK